MKIDPYSIKELRGLTGAGVMECKKVLEETSGDMDKAKALLKEIAEGLARKKADKETKAGIVDAYIHGNGNLGVLIEVHCETDFLAMNRDFRVL